MAQQQSCLQATDFLQTASQGWSTLIINLRSRKQIVVEAMNTEKNMVKFCSVKTFYFNVALNI